MRVLITGAAGFIGQLLAQKLLNDEEGRYTLILTDVVEPPIPQNVKWPEKAQAIVADLCKDASLVVDKALDAVFVFHGIMSSGAEFNYELGMKVNFDATRILLETLRNICPGVRVIYASSQAVYGGKVVQPVTEAMAATPETSYGAEKMMCEYLINDYTRRSFINGLILRFPTVSVRPGKPTAAASSFLSGIIREPMNGQECVIPIEDRSFRHWLCSPRVLVSNLEYSLTLPKDALPSYDRTVNHPGIGVSVQDMIDSLARVGGQDKLKYLREKEDPKLKPILYSWPAEFDNTRALSLGFKRDVSFDDIVRDYKESLPKSA
ncbi:D-erythronate dehydrogenase [Exophiala dermatitidis]|uniref:Nucleoside-diphosphate-sugar epimerase n=1 Tax=Exophiala dermatitidis (strain ATCC 34100 / CBS 525.76 / NIH/UT8656) TaxID=858893 RepID=H6BQS4_EXODN|nr:nucleoside-diphosphate-sugar epimerase [Exophiala dermatitidis NIH/UT8656]EHY54613.1 nucleoside-diphosphate-sugar epimerase [Exophiala dermatitidis NIH/UT8656]